MKVKIQVLANRNVQVWRGKDLLKEFEVAVAPQKGLQFFFQINKLLTSAGQIPIYKSYQWEQFFLWSLHQEELLNRFCMPFMQNLELLNFIESESLDIESWHEPASSGLGNLLTVWAKNKNQSMSFLTAIKRTVQFMIWFAITTAALIKIRYHKIKIGLFSYDTLWAGHTFDRRLKDIYGHFYQEQIPFIEIFPAFDISAIKNLFSRKRVALYFPPVSLEQKTDCKQYNDSEFSEIERKFIKKVIPIVESWMARDRKITPQLSTLLKLSGLQKIFSIDDNWTTSPLILACRRSNIELIAIAHGYYCQYHQGNLQTAIPSDFTCGFPKILVWGNIFKKFLLTKGNNFKDNQIISAGHSRPPSLLPRTLTPKKGDQPFTILYPYEFLADFKQISEYLKIFVKKGFRIYFKSRWDENIQDQLGSLPREHFKIVDEIDEELLSQIDVCAGCQSSVLYDMYYLGIPMWYLDTTSDFLSHTAEFGIATKITLEKLKAENFDPYENLLPPKSDVFESKSLFRFLR